jgi:hypothetical protein
MLALSHEMPELSDGFGSATSGRDALRTHPSAPASEPIQRLLFQLVHALATDAESIGHLL